MNLSTVKWAQGDKTQSRELLGPFTCVCIALCTIVAHNIAQKRRDNFSSSTGCAMVTKSPGSAFHVARPARETARSVNLYAQPWQNFLVNTSNPFSTFCASRRRRKMYCGHARLCVCPQPYANTTARTRM